MSSRCSKRGHFGVQIAAVILGAVLAYRVGAHDLLRVCVDQASPTSAIGLRVVRAVAADRGYSVTVVPFEGYGKGGDGFPPGRFAKMATSDCELIMGFPVDVGEPKLPPNVQATTAYARTGFMLVRRGDLGPMSLAEMPKGTDVGIAQLDTYAGLLFSLYPNIVMSVYPTDSQMLADVAANRLPAGLAWQPSIESYQRAHPRLRPLNTRFLSGPHMLWNLVALYGPQSEDIAQVFNQGLVELEAQGRLEALIKPYEQASSSPARHSALHRRTSPLQYAFAWESDAGRLVEIADKPTNNNASGKHGKIAALYTDEQASNGSLEYYKNCSMCHGPLLDGQLGGYSGPALKGPEFADPSYDFHVSDIFNFVAKLMPPGTPGSLTHEQDVLIMAFLLQQNGYPSGKLELTYDIAEKSRVPLRYHGK
jgi:polar amino acid transport system substrate-binding protein